MTDISEDDIRKRAYALWEADGRPEGSRETHWLQASHELSRPTETEAPQTAAAPEATDGGGTESVMRKRVKVT